MKIHPRQARVIRARNELEVVNLGDAVTELVLTIVEAARAIRDLDRRARTPVAALPSWSRRQKDS